MDRGGLPPAVALGGGRRIGARAIRSVLRRLLERSGHQVTEAESAESAIAAVRGTDRPDAIVCDVVMPGRSGIDLYGDLVAVASGGLGVVQ